MCRNWTDSVESFNQIFISVSTTPPVEDLYRGYNGDSLGVGAHTRLGSLSENFRLVSFSLPYREDCNPILSRDQRKSERE